MESGICERKPPEYEPVAGDRNLLDYKCAAADRNLSDYEPVAENKEPPEAESAG